MCRAVFAVFGLVALSSGSLLAQSSLFTPKVEADPVQEYLVTPEAGPWLILAAHYSGPNARELARQMVQHLRAKEGLSAYLFRHVNDDQMPRAEERERKRVRVEEHWAVMVGGYSTVEAARKEVDHVKKLAPPQLTLAGGAATTDFITQYVPNKERGGYEIHKAPVNPFATAFVTRNPAVKQEAVKDTSKEDQFLRTLNFGRPYSVYNCKKPFTLVVKDYGGMTVTQPRSATGAFFNAVTLGNMLDASGKQAEELARVLRESLKHEAYVLHRRRDSLVCVGSFDGPEDPALVEMKNYIRNLRIGSETFWINPAPMPVPL
jgi:hypothetical protein